MTTADRAAAPPPGAAARFRIEAPAPRIQHVLAPPGSPVGRRKSVQPSRPGMLDFAPPVGAHMILPRYHISPSRIPGAGKGVFIDEPADKGSILIAPDAIPRTWTFGEIEAMPDAKELLPATVRWFENRYTISTDWPDECFVNHSFEPSGLWHLGFIFATTRLDAGTEITVDYRHLLAPGQEEDFHDAQSGRPIVGFTWNESLRASSQALLGLLG